MKLISLFLLLFSTTLFPQRGEILEGDFTNLKGISVYNLIFDYSNVSVPHYDTEEAFLSSIVEEYESLEEGKGEQFKKDWFSNREKYYEPEFMNRFNYYLKKGEIKVGMNLDKVDYTNLEKVDYFMEVQMVHLYTDYANKDLRANSEISANISFYNINEPENILLKVQYFEINAETSKSTNQASKVSKSYGQLGKLLALDIRKSLK